MKELAGFLQQLREAYRQDAADLEPDVDDKDLQVDRAKLKEDDDLAEGAVLRATVEPGQGSAKPQDGDLVFLHYAVLGADDVVLESTRAEHGGPGHPRPFILGKGARMLRGMELVVRDMLLGERCVASIKPAYAYSHGKAAGMAPPAGQRAEDPARVDLQLTHWYGSTGTAGVAGGVAALGPESDVFKRSIGGAEGWESPRPPFEVSVHVTAHEPSTSGRQEGGQQGAAYFTTGAGAPLVCMLGTGQLPPGLEAGLAGMHRGEEAVVSCPAALALGGSAVPGPPGGARPSPLQRVEYRVRLLDFLQVRDLVGGGHVVKRTRAKGRGDFPADCPLEDSTVRVHLRVGPADLSPASAQQAQQEQAAEAWVLNTRGADGAAAPLEFDTGMGEAPEAVDMAVRLMLPGEVAAVRSSWQYAYEGRDDAPEGLEPGAPVEFEIELVSFVSEANPAALDPDGLLARAERWKGQGNDLFRGRRYALAQVKYNHAMRWAQQAGREAEDEEQADRAAGVRAACAANLAACAQRQEQFGEAVSWASKALKEDPHHVKAYFRRAAAHASLGNYSAAREDLATAVRIDPGAAPEAEAEAARLDARERRQEEKQRRELKSFFDRGAGKEQQGADGT